MSDQPYSDGGEDYGGEDFIDAPEQDEDASAEDLQTIVSGTVDAALAEQQAAERVLAFDPRIGTDPEVQKQFLAYVDEQAERAGVDSSIQFGAYLIDNQPGGQGDTRTPSEVWDQEVAGSTTLGGRVLDFDS